MEQNKPATGLALLKSAIESDKVQGRLQQCVKENKGAFASSILDLYTGDKSLQTCEPNAIIAECLKAAALNLPVNKALGFAYVVVYNNNKKQSDGSWVKVPTPTFILGYKGYIQLAMRTGQYRTVNADVVYEGELRHKDKLSGMIDLSGEKTSDKIIGYFAYFEMLNGFSKTLYMSLRDMADYAIRYSPSMPKGTKPETLMEKANDGLVSKQVGWLGNFNDMAIKTCIRRLISKYGYMSIEMQDAYTEDINSDKAMEERQSIVDNTANVAIDVTKMVEEVDTATGEIKEAAPAVDINEDPGY